MKSSPDSPDVQDEFWERIDALATGALMSIPVAGPSIADFFTNTIVPTFSGVRNRIFGPIVRPFLRSRRRNRPCPANDTTS